MIQILELSDMISKTIMVNTFKKIGKIEHLNKTKQRYTM